MRLLMILLVPLVILAVYNARADSERGNGTMAGNPTQVGETANAENRYTLLETEDGFVRLDRQTGIVTLCTGIADNFTCKTVADDRVAYEDEIRRLYEENQALQEQLAVADSNRGEANRGERETGLVEHDGERYVFSMELPNQQDMQDGVDAMGEFADDVATGFEDMVKSLKERLNRNDTDD
ncbi:MAG: hypothetical protein JKY32_00025 [Rhizobiales bacterium]|nr:hypothetical protein [Hyphomicrobiales bacterium]